MSDVLINQAKSVFMNNYKPFPVVFEYGKGVYLFDDAGKKYLDFVSGIAVNALGYGYEPLNIALKKQIDKFTHCSNLYYNEPGIEAATLLVKTSGLGRVFFCNSGAEAIEASLKLARKYAKKFLPNQPTEIVAMKESFHGRTYGAISATGQFKYQKDLSPLLPGIVHCDYNNLEALKAVVNDNTCAVLMELVQGEGGVIPANVEYVQAVRKLCDEKGILLIFDEVQTGIGRTGKMFAYENFGIKPDIVALAKGLGAGIPIGACVATEAAAKGFEPGDHAATFGGNPLSTTAASVTLSTLSNENFMEDVAQKGAYLRSKLEALKDKYESVTDVRGLGLMQGMEISYVPGEFIAKVMEKGLLLVGAGSQVIRFVPPLVVTKAEIDQAINIVEEVLEEMKGNA